MRFSLGRLLLLFPAYGLAVLAAPFVAPPRRIARPYDNAVSEVAAIRRNILFADSQGDGAPTPEEVLARWLDGRGLSQAEQRRHRLSHVAGLDAWDRAYQYTRDAVDRDGRPVGLGVYSLGKDGRTETGGNDADDVNSWNRAGDRSAVYDREFQRKLRTRNAFLGFAIAPFIFALIVYAHAAAMSRLGLMRASRWPKADDDA